MKCIKVYRRLCSQTLVAVMTSHDFISIKFGVLHQHFATIHEQISVYSVQIQDLVILE